jgi:hypothetical protein
MEETASNEREGKMPMRENLLAPKVDESKDISFGDGLRITREG